MLNFARYLSGLPSDVYLDATKNVDAQYGAVLLAVSNYSHTPNKPSNMTQAFYDRGYAATSSSNIGWGHLDLATFTQGCLQDDDAGNIGQVGHRRWILNPRMLKTGMGYANARATTSAFDTSRAALSYSVIAYPSAGLFPATNGFMKRTTPWSVTLNPDRYDWNASSLTVTMKRVADGRTWTFNSADTNTAGEYFAFNTLGYGVPACLIFRPDPASISYAVGDQFDIKVSGGLYTQGTTTPTTIAYRTTMISLDGSAATDPGNPPIGVDNPPAAVGTLLGFTADNLNPAYNTGTVAFTATLKSAALKPLGGRPVTLERLSGSNWVPVRTQNTISNGTATFYEQGIKTKQTYRVKFAGVANQLGYSASSQISILPKVRFKRTTSWKKLTRNRTYYSKGYIEPRHKSTDAKVVVKIYKKCSDGSYRYVKKSKASYTYYNSVKTKYTAKIRLTSKGVYKLVAYHYQDSKNAATYGSPDYVTVK